MPAPGIFLRNATTQTIRNVSKMIDSSTHTSSPYVSNFRSATFYCAIIMLACCLIGLVGNAVSFWVFTRRCMRSSPINVLLASLCAVDMAVLIAAIAVFVIPNLNTFWYYVDPGSLYRIIVLAGFYQGLQIASTCSVWTFVLIAVERYVAVCSPFNARQRLTVNKARCAFLVILVMACVYNAPRFFEYQVDEERGYVALLRNNFYYFSIYYTTLYLLTHFLGPFLIITILNAIIFKAMRRARHERTQMSKLRNEKKTKRKHQTTRMITLVTIIFGLCNILPFVLNIWEGIDGKMFQDHRLAAYLTLDVSNVLVVLNSSSTFIIYFLYCEKYRSLIKNRLFSCFRSMSSSPRLSDTSETAGERRTQEMKVRFSLSQGGNSVTYGSYVGYDTVE